LTIFDSVYWTPAAIHDSPPLNDQSLPNAISHALSELLKYSSNSLTPDITPDAAELLVPHSQQIFVVTDKIPSVENLRVVADELLYLGKLRRRISLHFLVAPNLFGLSKEQRAITAKRLKAARAIGFDLERKSAGHTNINVVQAGSIERFNYELAATVFHHTRKIHIGS
jgi:hypothetical protein